jgi:periplasmic protein TonB
VGQRQQQAGNWKKYLGMAATVLAIFALLGWGLNRLLDGNSGKKVKAPKISLLTPPPPPPPPPPKIEKKPPEPPKEQKEIKIDQPLPKVEAPAPAPELKMDGPAGDGPSNFAGGNITSEDLSKIGSGTGSGTGTGTGKGGLFNPFSNYAGLLKGELQRFLGKNNELRRRQYRIEVRVWVNGDGSVKRSELIGTTGDGDTDDAIRRALTALPSFSSSPPADMPQPIRLRIVTTGRT